MKGFMNIKLKRKPSKKVNTLKKSGASRSNTTAFSFPVNVTLSKMLMAVAFVVLGVVFYGSLVVVETVLDVPVNQVEVQADLEFQLKREITEVINGHVIDGFVRADLQQLQRELLSMPWVYEVSIKRKLPHGLVVELSEQEPVAYWNNDALVNRYGELFYPEEIPVISGMPVLSGKDYKQVLSVYKRLKTLLPGNQQPVVALHIGDRNTVNVTTVLQSELIFNIERLDEQAMLWQHISVESMGDRLSDVKQADLRYSNGAAVQWKNIVALHNETIMGGH